MKHVLNMEGSVRQCQPLTKRKRRVHHLIGKVLHCPRCRDDEIREAKKDAITDIKEAWKDNIDTSDFVIKQLRDDTLRISFQHPLDKQWVMDGKPWLLGYQGHLLMLDEWGTPDSDLFQTCPFWVQAHGIPYKLMSKELGYEIGKLFGADQPLQVDFDENARPDFLRFRVMVNVKERVITGCWLALPKNDNDDDKLLWVRFTYEELSYMCFLCGFIGHHTNMCDSYLVMKRAKDETPNTIIINGAVLENEKPPVVREGQIIRDMHIRGYGNWLEDQSQFEKGVRYYSLDDRLLCTEDGYRREGRIVVPKYNKSKTCGYEASDDAISVRFDGAVLQSS